MCVACSGYAWCDCDCGRYNLAMLAVDSMSGRIVCDICKHEVHL